MILDVVEAGMQVANLQYDVTARVVRDLADIFESKASSDGNAREKYNCAKVGINLRQAGMYIGLAWDICKNKDNSAHRRIVDGFPIETIALRVCIQGEEKQFIDTIAEDLFRQAQDDRLIRQRYDVAGNIYHGATFLKKSTKLL